MRRGAAAMTELRILATTDLHMHVLSYDYFAERPSDSFGLERTAALIAAERATATNSLLLDNGDFLQGNPMGDYLAETSRTARHRPHPAIAAMNLLQYDAATLGNHDFSFGLPFLERTLSGAQFPYVSTNITRGTGLPLVDRIVLRRELLGQDGIRRPIAIGLLGFLPPQTAEWEPELRGVMEIDDILIAAKRGIAALKQDGADLIIALSHSGIGPLTASPRMENAATALAALPGIDVVIAGHTHRIFPAPDHGDSPGIDAKLGSLAGKPAVMAGFWGSHLGVINLTLAQTALGRWRIEGFTSHAKPVPKGANPSSSLRAAMQGSHRDTIRHFRRRIGYGTTPLTSHFTHVGHDPALKLVTTAQSWYVRRMLRDSRWRDLPILSAAAPFRAGGRGGPDHYTSVPAGPLTLRNVSDLYLFPNRVCAILVTGTDLRHWLERSAGMFQRVTPGIADQPLIDPNFPGYNFDVIDGLEWRIDLTVPAGSSGRVTDLSHRGRPVAPDQRFVLVTNNYRLSESGFFGAVAANKPVLFEGAARTRDVLRRYIARRPVLDQTGQLGWRFRPCPGTSVLFDTAPTAVAHLGDLAPRVEPVGPTASGFLRMRLHL